MGYVKHIVSNLSDADGEQLETQHWPTEATGVGYLSPEKPTELTNLCKSIGRMLDSTIAKSDSFTGPDNLVKEDSIGYLPTTDSTDY